MSAFGYRKALAAGRARPATLARLTAALAAARRRAGRAGAEAEAMRARVVALRAGAAALVAAHYGVTPAEALDGAQGEERTGCARWRAGAHARQAAIYLVHVTLGLSQADLGRALGLSRVAVCLACRAVEDRRDDPALDRLLAGAERLLKGETP